MGALRAEQQMAVAYGQIPAARVGDGSVLTKSPLLEEA